MCAGWVRGEGRGVSNSYGVKDAACPLSTRGGGVGSARASPGRAATCSAWTKSDSLALRCQACEQRPQPGRALSARSESRSSVTASAHKAGVFNFSQL